MAKKKKVKYKIIVAKMSEDMLQELYYMPISFVVISEEMIKDEKFKMIGKLVKKVYEYKTKKS